MLKLKILTLLFSIKVALCTDCRTEKRKSDFDTDFCAYTITQVGNLPKEVGESSGLAHARKGHTYWTHNDGGNAPELYEIDPKGNLLRTLPLVGTRNRDWEDLAQDEAGNLYVGDFGNNLNQRQDLKIYKFHPDQPTQIDSITFRYSDQEAFPPPKERRDFDAEAFFWHSGRLYIFSKNRGSRQVKVYTLPDTPGNHLAEVSSTFQMKGQITAADINPSRSLFAVLAYGKVLFFELKEDEPLLAHPLLCTKVARSQAEALVFINDTDLLITNEQGKIFLVEKSKSRIKK